MNSCNCSTSSTNCQPGPFLPYGSTEGIGGGGLSSRPPAPSGSLPFTGDITDGGGTPYTTDYSLYTPGGNPDMPGSDLMQILSLLIALISRILGNGDGNGLGGNQNVGSSGQGFRPLSFDSAGGGAGYVGNPPPAPAPAGGTGQQPRGGPAAPGPAAPTHNQTSGASGAGQDIPVDGGGPNKITVTNKSDKPQSFAIFTNPGPGATSSFDVPNGFVTLQPGESANFNVPQQYSGYVQQMNNYTQDDYLNRRKPDPLNFKATRAEFTFDANGMLSFNKSNIMGHNADLGMSSGGQVIAPKGSIISGIEKDHPNLILNIGGQKAVDGPDSFVPQRNMEAAAILDQYLNNSSNPYDYGSHSNTYVLPDDHAAVRVDRSNNLSLDFGNA